MCGLNPSHVCMIQFFHHTCHAVRSRLHRNNVAADVTYILLKDFNNLNDLGRFQSLSTKDNKDSDVEVSLHSHRATKKNKNLRKFLNKYDKS